MNYVITTMQPTSLHKGLSPFLSVISQHGDALLLSAWHLEPYTLSNESGYQSGCILKGSEAGKLHL